MRLLLVALPLSLAALPASAANAVTAAGPIELGPRPAWLVRDMDASPLKDRLLGCLQAGKPAQRSDFSIGHRGAALQFPEHTRESYQAAAQMGAGIVECDVTFTADKKLVCRHSQCDLHRTTNILSTPLAKKCSKPFRPAAADQPAKARCCTSDITLAEFKTLRGKMDAVNSQATTVDEYLNGTANWRTDLYASRGSLMSHRESIELFKSLGVKMTPELKKPEVAMPFHGYAQSDFARHLIDEYRQAKVDPAQVFAQSFQWQDIAYWLKEAPDFGRRAIYLDGRYRSGLKPGLSKTFSPDMRQLANAGLQTIAPPMWMLLTRTNDGQLVPSAYAKAARQAGLSIVTWTLERSGPLTSGGGWYYQSIKDGINNDGDMLTVLHALAKDVGVTGVFSDWPATTTFYANCLRP